MTAPSTNDPVAATTQALDNDGFAPLTCVNGARNAARKRACDSATQCVATVSFTQCSAHTGAQHSRRHRILIKLTLVAGQRLASS